ncbi:MAG: TIGR03545 family protein, partial [Pseudobdellovibrionaceae bacterium]
MADSKDTAETTPVKKNKSKGPIRFEAILPTVFIVAGIWAYFFFFFDLHLKKGIEWGGYQALGAEVNVKSLKTSFWKASMQIQGVEFTNSEKPTHNIFELGDIRFSMLWDALLRAKVVINEMAIEQIRLDTKRSHVGRVKPPEPPKTGPSMTEELTKKALDKVQDEYSGNVLGDIAALLQGTDGKEILKSIESELKSQLRAKELETFVNQKKAEWDTRIKSLPNQKDLKALQDRSGKIKFTGFKNPKELETSLKELDAVAKDADKYYKELQTASNALGTDVKSLDQQAKDLEAQVKKDIKELESRFRIPKIDAASISKSLFKKYVDPYIAKADHYKELVYKYAPPNLIDKKKPDEIPVQPQPRAKGVSYEFGRPNSYPLFWIKRAAVSSKSQGSSFAGDLLGEIRNVSNNQMLTGQPITAEISGGFPEAKVDGLQIKLTIDRRKEQGVDSFLAQVGSYPLPETNLISSPDVELGFASATGAAKIMGEFVHAIPEGKGAQDKDAKGTFKFSLDNSFKDTRYKVDAKNKDVLSILKGVFDEVKLVTLSAEGQGEFPNIGLNISSNLGDELRKGFEREIQEKINELRARIEKQVRDRIEQEKAKIEAEIAKIKNQLEGEINKTKAQIEAAKKDVEDKVQKAKKDAENQLKKAKKEEESKQKKKAEQELKKKADELKKKFKF